MQPARRGTGWNRGGVAEIASFHLFRRLEMGQKYDLEGGCMHLGRSGSSLQWNPAGPKGPGPGMQLRLLVVMCGDSPPSGLEREP